MQSAEATSTETIVRDVQHVLVLECLILMICSMLNVISLNRTHAPIINDIPLLSVLIALTYISRFVAPVAHQVSFDKFTCGTGGVCEEEMKGLPYLVAREKVVTCTIISCIDKIPISRHVI